LSNFIKAKIYEISENGEFIILAMESDIDHVHLMIQYLPKISISYIIQKIKQITTFYVWRNKKFELFLKQNFWKEKTFWTDGFLLVV
jgi:putative transposase